MRTLLAVLSLAAAPLSAQTFSLERHRLLPAATWSAVAAADFDLDGDVDLVVRTSVVQFLVNDGSGRFAAGQTFAAYGGALATGDLDGDGDADVAVGGAAGFGMWFPGVLLRNDGAGGFTDVSSQWPSSHEASTRVLLVDYDGDGDRDLLTGAWPMGQAAPGGVQPINRLYLNDGAGTFTDATAARLPTLSAGTPAVGDLDGDGDLDFVLPGRSPHVAIAAPIHVWLQNAAGVAVAAPGLVPAAPVIGGFTDVAVFDRDGDGDLDVLAGSNQDVQWFHNLGGATFAFGGSLPIPHVHRFATADFDGDGRLDALVTRQEAPFGPPWPVRQLRNTGAGFVDVTATAFENVDLAPQQPLAVDVDGDGDADVVGSLAPQPAVWHNDGQGRLLQLAVRAPSAANVIAATAADVDVDGALDVAAIERGPADRTRVVWWRGDRFGLRAAPTELLPWSASERAYALQWVDADRDGDQDLFVAHAAQYRLFHWTGAGFVDATAASMPALGGATRVVAGDLDGDGVVDLLTAGWSTHWLRGDGVGGFVDATSALPPAPASSSDAALFDLDADGDLDVVQTFAGWTGSAPLRILRNDLGGAFVDVTASLGMTAVPAWTVAAVDVDGDGRRDLVLGRYTGALTGLAVYRRTATGFVDESSLRAPPMVSIGSLAALDFDGDGDEDLACADAWDVPSGVLRLDQGAFAVLPLASFAATLSARPAAADFDRDGDVDFVSGPGLVRSVVRDAFFAAPPRLGMPAELVLQAHAGDGVNPQWASLALATQLASPPLALGSFGVLGLAPGSVILHSAHPLPPAGGERSVPFAVPASPTLLGTPLFAQALFVHEPAPATWRLGNVLDLTVRL